MKTWLCRKNAPSYRTIVAFLPVWQGNVLTIITTTVKYEVSFPSNFGQGDIITIIIESENFFPSYFDQVSLPTPRSPFVSTPPFSVPSNISGRPKCSVIVCLFSAEIFERESFYHFGLSGHRDNEFDIRLRCQAKTKLWERGKILQTVMVLIMTLR